MRTPKDCDCEITTAEFKRPGRLLAALLLTRLTNVAELAVPAGVASILQAMLSWQKAFCMTSPGVKRARGLHCVLP